MDCIKKTIGKHERVRAIAAVTTDLVHEATKLHQTTPVASAALGRALTAAAMMGSMLKNEGETVSLQLKGNGPLQTVFAMSDPAARVRGYVGNPLVDVPKRPDGKLNVGAAVGREGLLCVVRNNPAGDPYVGQVPLVSGEIGDDLTLYYARSEQLPTAVGLGVLVDVDYSIKAAGGFIVSLLPGAEEETIQRIEQGVASIPSITDFLSGGMDCDQLLHKLLPDIELAEMEQMTPTYFCPCDRERMERGLLSLGAEELDKLIQEQGHAELVCHFCNRQYDISRECLEKLKEQAKTKKKKEN